MIKVLKGPCRFDRAIFLQTSGGHVIRGCWCNWRWHIAVYQCYRAVWRVQSSQYSQQGVPDASLCAAGSGTGHLCLVTQCYFLVYSYIMLSSLGAFIQ